METEIKNNKNIKEVITPLLRKISKHKKIISLAGLIIVCISVGIIIEYYVFKNFYVNSSENKKLDPELNEFIESYEYIINNYYKDIDKKALIDNAIEGMIESLGDEYSSFLKQTEGSNYDIYLKGEYVGIGVQIFNTINDGVVVGYIFENSPASKAGLEIGDVILKIDDLDVTTNNEKEINNIIKNKQDKFNVVVKRGNEEKTFSLEKASIEIKSVESKILDNNIGYMMVDIFALNTYKQFKDQLSELEKNNINGLIIDLRDNSGGHLTSVEKMISLFLDDSHVIYQTDTKGKIEKFYSSGKETKKYPIVLISNNNSASASEVMIGTLKEEYGALQVGQTTFGKGTVQQLNNLSGGEKYKITIKKWLTPKGVWIDGVGIKPDVEVELNEDYYANPSLERDNQLQEAIKLINEKNIQ